MSSTTSRTLRPGYGLALAALGLFSGANPASGQQTFDPYRPEQAPYNSSSFPSQPNNYALPNAAREASEYDATAAGAGTGGSRFNTFDRYMSGSAGDLFSNRRAPTGAGVPYYDSYRRLDSTFGRSYNPNSESDRNFNERPSEFTRRATERDRLYKLYTRERDPARRAQLYREMQNPAEARGAAAPAAPAAPTARGGAPRRVAPTTPPAESAATPRDPRDITPRAPNRSPSGGLGPVPPPSPSGRSPAGTAPAIGPRPLSPSELGSRVPMPPRQAAPRPTTATPRTPSSTAPPAPDTPR